MDVKKSKSNPFAIPVTVKSKSKVYSQKCLALAVTSDGNIDQLGDSDDGDLSVQDDAEK